MDTDIAPLRQLLYVSSSHPQGTPIDIAKVVEQSRHNNALDGVTGLLWTDSKRFLQVLEGTAEGVGTTFARIKQDPRHHAIVVLHDRQIDKRQFGSWTMVQRQAGDDADVFDEQIRRVLENASDTVRGNFLGLIAARR